MNAGDAPPATPMTTALAKRPIGMSQVLARVRAPEEVPRAKVVEFLTTDLSDYVTGQVIPVCGGVCLF